MRNNEKYPNGYLPKIEFWEAKYIMALEEGIHCYARGDKRNGAKWNEVAKGALEKVSYFKAREAERLEVGRMERNIW